MLKTRLTALGALLVLGVMGRGQGQVTPEMYPNVRANFVSYTVRALGGQVLRVGGKLQVPQGVPGRMPAVLIVHGSAGVDSRGQMHALDLNRAGFVTLEIDMWGARGLAGGTEGRPKAVWETLPDAYGAFEYLAKLPEVDSSRIGITGFSWGGVVAMLTATKRYNDQYLPSGQHFAGHVPFYPVCWVYNAVPGYEFGGLTGAPVRILAGGRDRYDNDPRKCPSLAASLAPEDHALVTVRVYENAEHGFDMLEASNTYRDPYLYQGKGGEGLSAPNAAAREDSRHELVRFFQNVFGTR